MENRFKQARTKYNRHGAQSTKEVEKATGVTKSLIEDLESTVYKRRGVSYLKVKKLAEYYGVSSDYLLELSSTPSVKEDEQMVCKMTGLSAGSVQCLNRLTTIAEEKYAKAIDFLLLDLQEQYKSNDFRSVLDLLCFFLKYDDICDTKKQVFSDGHIADYAGGEISTDAIALNERIIENAALMEMEQALISLKKLLRKEQGSDGKH